MSGLDWSPDGEHLVLSAAWGPEESSRLYLWSLADRDTVPLGRLPAGYRGDYHPAFSPDGRTVAFSRADALYRHELWITSIGGGESRRIATSRGQVNGLAWTADGRSVVFASGRGFPGQFDLWLTDVAGGGTTWLPSRGRRAMRPSIARGADCLVFEEQSFECNLVRLRHESIESPETVVIPLVPSTQSDWNPRHSPSGGRLAFVSNRTGSPEVWVCGPEGERLRRITDMGGAQIENLRWSYDETRVAFNTVREGEWELWIADVESRSNRAVPVAGGIPSLLNWSCDGAWLYVNTPAEDGWKTDRVPVNGGERVTVLDGEAYMLFESSDGATLYHSGPGIPNVIRTAADGTGERVLFEIEDGIFPCFWSGSDAGVHCFRRGEDEFLLEFRDFATGETSLVAKVPTFPGLTLDVSPDGRSLVGDRIDRIGSDLVIADDFL
jgi:dipeptidyl aminopeptidase/acylaminoacyl peptidase